MFAIPSVKYIYKYTMM